MAIDIKGLNHYAIAVSNLNASLSFYRHILGMKEIYRPAFDFEGAWLDSGNGIVIHLIEQPDIQIKCTGSRGLHFAFIVEDIHQTRQILISKGISIEKDIKPRPDNVWQMFIQDPDGYYIEFNQMN